MANLQVDPMQLEMKKNKCEEVEAWIAEEMKDQLMFSEKLDTMTGMSMERSRLLLKWEKASEKVKLLQKILKETNEGNGPYESIATEFRKRFYQEETDYAKKMIEVYEQENTRLRGMLEAVQEKTTQEMEETGSVSSWNRMEVPFNA